MRRGTSRPNFPRPAATGRGDLVAGGGWHEAEDTGHELLGIGGPLVFEGGDNPMDGVIVKLLDYLVAAVDRADARGWEAEADALAWLYQATGGALLSEAGDSVSRRIREALERVACINPRLARAIRPAFTELLPIKEVAMWI